MFSVSRHSLIQWILLLILGGVLLAWQLAERSTSRHGRETMALSETSLRRPGDTFVVLRYPFFGRIRERQNGDFASLLSEHLKMLHQEGYNTITVGDVLEFYRKGRLLPEKSVLVTFDDEQGDVFRIASKVLEKRSLRAMAFITFGKRMGGNRVLLPWHSLRKAFGSGYWEMGSKGVRSTRYVTVNEQGTAGHFLSNRRWLRSEKRLETEEEYKRRIRGDVRDGGDILESRIEGLQIKAFAYPFSDYGQGMTNANDAEDSILAAVQGRYSLAFTHGDYGWNFKETAPFLLNRMTVDDALNSSRLLRRLEASAPREGSIFDDFDRPRLPECWHLETGECAYGDGRLVLSPKSGQVGGQLWLSGTEKWRNYSVEVTVESNSDEQWWVYLRHKNKDNFARVGRFGNDLYVQQKIAGGELHSVGKFPDIFEPRTAHRLRVSLRGHRVQLSYDDVPLGTGKIEIGDRLSRGKIGLGVVSQRPGEGSASFSAFRAEESGAVLILAQNLDSADTLEQVSGLLPQVEMFSPAWFTISPRTGLVTPRIENRDLVRMLASYNNLRLMPTVWCRSAGNERSGEFRDRSKQEDLAETLISHATKLSLDGYLFWLEREGASLLEVTSAEEARIVAPEWIGIVRDHLRSEGLRFAVGMRFENARQLGQELLSLSELADMIVAKVESEEGCHDSAWVGSPFTRAWTISRTQLYLVSQLDPAGDSETMDARLSGMARAVFVGDEESNHQERKSEEETGAFQ